MTSVQRLFLLLFFSFSCQSKENKRESLQNKQDSVFVNFQDKLAFLGIHYKYYNPVILDPGDDDFAALSQSKNNLRVSKQKLSQIGIDSLMGSRIDSSSYYRLFSFHKLENGCFVLGLSNNMEGGTFMEFLFYDSKGKFIKDIFGLGCWGDAGAMIGGFATFKSDTFNIQQFNSWPSDYTPNHSFSNLVYKNYRIRFDKNNNVLVDTLKSIKYKNLMRNEFEYKLDRMYNGGGVKYPFGRD